MEFIFDPNVKRNYLTIIELIKKFVFVAIIVISFVNCGSQPTSGPETSQELEAPKPLEIAHRLIEEAQTKIGLEKFTLLILASEQLMLANEYHWAEQILAETDPDLLPPAWFARWSIVRAKAALIDEEYELAKQYLVDSFTGDTTQHLPTQLTIRLRELRADIFFYLEEFDQSVKERLAINQLIAVQIEASAEFDREENESHILKLQEQQAFNETLLWQALMEMPSDKLNMLAQNYPDPQSAAWYQLARLSKNNQTNLEQQVADLEQWIANWPEHPASLRLPADLRLLTEIAANQPAHIAVLLPLSQKFEKAANAIRDGIMAAFYQRSASGQKVPIVDYYDTTTGDIAAVYQQAVDEGADLVIGPLQKNAISELALELELPVPLLTLNNIDNPLDSPGLYQFGLAIEDEIQQIVDQAWLDGHRRALILAPADSRGDRCVSAFIPAWEALGGEVSHHYRYSGNNDYSSVIKKAMHVDQSELRAREIRRMFGRIEFEPRRRQDIDMVFVAVNDVKQARQIKPTLAFYFAGNVPVYATSNVFSGVSAPKLDQDLNGVQFTTLPWFFDQSSEIKRNISRFASKNPAYQRLYALGADAFNIYPRLRQLESIKQAKFYGFTGTLQLNENKQIVRQQQWVKFINGRARPQIKSSSAGHAK